MHDSELRDIYEIRLEGHLQKCWEEWLNGMSITHLENGETLITGPVTDQAALHGILALLRDIKIKLISVTKVS